MHVKCSKKADKGKETGSGGAPASKSAKAVKPGKAAPVKEAAVPPPEINLPPTPDVPPRPVEEGKNVYLKMAELHPFHTFREHPYKVQDDTVKALAEPDRLYGRYHPGHGPGTYQARVKATDSRFAGAEAGVTIQTGAAPIYTLNVAVPAFD